MPATNSFSALTLSESGAGAFILRVAKTFGTSQDAFNSHEDVPMMFHRSNFFFFCHFSLQVRVLELESQLTKERQKLGHLRKAHYQLAGVEEGLGAE